MEEAVFKKPYPVKRRSHNVQILYNQDKLHRFEDNLVVSPGSAKRALRDKVSGSVFKFGREALLISKSEAEELEEMFLEEDQS